ncbi:oxidoreductase [Bacteroidia bacterium]|nr:oxidoreductase [Bacteroidia bacterium]
MIHMNPRSLLIASVLLLAAGCRHGGQTAFTGAANEVELIVLDPGHFHAALVQKSSCPQVSPIVHVYAPQGEDVARYLDLIAAFNNRAVDPTHWNEVIYTGSDYLERMLAGRKGNLVVLAGRNGAKTDYIHRSVSAGFNVLSDKPMAIDSESFSLLLNSFAMARRRGVLLCDIMTERYEATNALQRELARTDELIGPIDRGTPDDPAIIKESVHHFSKVVSGAPLIRPEWYFDVKSQGEGIVDVTTHLVDLVQWTVVGEKPFDYRKQVRINSARRWPTPISKEQYRRVTGKDDYAPLLAPCIENDTLKVYSNGQIDYELCGINVRIAVRWDYAAPAGGGDTHYALVRGARGSVVIRQGAGQNYRPALYVEMAPGGNAADFERTLNRCVARLADGEYPGLEAVGVDSGVWQIVIPQKYDVGHEAHFGQVMQKYLRFLTEGKVPDWEVAGMKAKYYTTTRALEIATE